MGVLHHKRTSKTIAKNPIARAVARNNLAAAVTKQKIRLYMMEDGEPCADDMEVIGKTLAVVGYASELDEKIGGDDLRVRVLRGGLSACKQLMIADKWDSAQVRAIDVALDAAMELNAKVNSDCINKAVHDLGVL